MIDKLNGKWMHFLSKDDYFLKKYNRVKPNFNNEPAHNKKYLKTKIKTYKRKINIKEGSECTYISNIG